MVLISGEAGVGKSRLAKETVARAVAYSFLCLTGRCFETDRAIPYALLLDLLQAFRAPRPKDEIAAARARGHSLRRA